MGSAIVASQTLPYISIMLRAFTSVLWLIAALALGFEAVAQPCDLIAAQHASETHEMMAEMPCHDGIMSPAHEQMPDQELPNEHPSEACCCAALLGNAVTADAPSLHQPVPELSQWATPLPDTANSILLEYDPPPPRA